MQLVQLFFSFGFFRLDFTSKYARGRSFELLAPPMDLRLVDAELRAQLRDGPFTGKSSQGHRGLEGWGVIFTLVHSYSPCGQV